MTEHTLINVTVILPGEGYTLGTMVADEMLTAER